MSAELAKAYWLVLGSGWTDDGARQRFKEKFGYHAEQVIREKGYAWVGPIKEATLKPTPRPEPTPDLIVL